MTSVRTLRTLSGLPELYEKPVSLRGSVRGFSMWPNLIPGDLLKAQLLQVSRLRPGMIVVFPEQSGFHKIVHRVLSVRNFGEFSVVVSGGDRSGRDRNNGYFSAGELIPVVAGVLRRGRYITVSRVSIPVFVSPLFVVRNHCRIVRKLLW